jgi:hypothetical protein
MFFTIFALFAGFAVSTRFIRQGARNFRWMQHFSTGCITLSLFLRTLFAAWSVWRHVTRFPKISHLRVVFLYPAAASAG